MYHRCSYSLVDAEFIGPSIQKYAAERFVDGHRNNLAKSNLAKSQTQMAISSHGGISAEKIVQGKSKQITSA
ncbi:hypothetical protein Tco_1168479, partial [Tanacetum coccineum]